MRVVVWGIGVFESRMLWEDATATAEAAMLAETLSLAWDDIEGPLIAHEAGHYLEGMPFHYDNFREGFDPLMRGDGLIGDRLLRRDADRMNRNS